ncbi:MAG: alpha/beta fold hydrolase [Trebonia sp.]
MAGSPVGSPVILGSGGHHVVAIHGWFGSARGWGSLPAYLDGTSYTYAFMDLRGYGDRKSAVGEYTAEEVASDVLALAGSLGWDRFSVLGHSMGGKFGHRVLIDAPDRVRALVGVNPVPAAATPMDDQTRGLFHGAIAEAGNRAAIIDFTTGSRLTRAFVDEVVGHSVSNSSADAFGAYLTAWAHTDFSASAGVRSDVPVKVIVGENDPALSAEVMTQTWLKYFPAAELEVLANAGHYPMFETPVALATSIERFLGASSGASSGVG